MAGRDGKAQTGDEAVMPLSALKHGASARVVQVAHDSQGHWRKLSALGIVPGATVRMVQRFPTFVVQVGYTLVAIDSELASQVQVQLE
ncbi:MAG: ferrous iron transport protein A [Fimbriimonadales bacterium]|jgi:DtxR family Mn-dependent transcriptional regulator/ferrous iron transport protein A|nr:ferrous iron transport protein A [Armatimonadota bacterium]MCX7687073.1 ferrous iron transport protein A [Fimbriimonadales bacterium]